MLTVILIGVLLLEKLAMLLTPTEHGVYHSPSYALHAKEMA